jgi:galactose mutarotase-like enzyme
MTLSRSQHPYPHWCFQAANGDQLRLVPERGGLISGWRCGGVERLYFDAARFADPALSVRGGIPVLFPVCGNLPDNRLELPQGSFTLPQHGFARDRPWRFEPLADGQGVRLELRDDAASRASFPFAFSLALEVRLEASALAIRGLVRNEAVAAEAAEGAAMMPFAFGLHPYFAVADLGAVGLEGLPPQGFDHLRGAMAPTAEQLQRLGRGVDLRLDTEPGAAPRLITDPSGVVVELQAQPPFAHTVIWTDPPRPMVCLEPWTARRGEMALELAPQQQLELSCRYVLREP